MIMLLFMYWLKNIKTGEEKNTILDQFFDIGSTLTIDEEPYEVIDYAVDQPIGCEELAERM